MQTVDYKIALCNEHVVAIEPTSPRAIAEDFEGVLFSLNEKILPNGIGSRRVLYKTTSGIWDEIGHVDSAFVSIESLGARSLNDAVMAISWPRPVADLTPRQAAAPAGKVHELVITDDVEMADPSAPAPRQQKKTAA